jgi:1-phosphatidylinositol phosphodiesterase
LVLAAACGGDQATDTGWVSTQPDTRKLSELSIPGTHESAALHDLGSSGTAKNQEITIAQQLAVGVRYLDIRCRNVQDSLELFHGPVYQQQTFDELLTTLASFLEEHPMETIVMSIQEEIAADRATMSFQEVFEAYVARDPFLWYVGATVPLLANVRGRIVLIRRFPSTSTPLGIDASAWQDDKTFTITTSDAKVRIQDEYSVSSNDSKWNAITSLFLEARAGDANTLFLNFTSGYQSDPLPDVKAVYSDINGRLNTYFADPANATGRLGIVAMDFANAPRVEEVIERNPPPE